MPTAELDQLIEQLRHRRWTQYLWGPADDLALVAWTYRYGNHCADVVILRGEGREVATGDTRENINGATAYRRPMAPGDNEWNPPLVMWQYHSTAVRTLRAVLTMAHPREFGAPKQPQLPGKECLLPVDLPYPRIVRPLGPFSPVPAGSISGHRPPS